MTKRNDCPACGSSWDGAVELPTHCPDCNEFIAEVSGL